MLKSASEPVLRMVIALAVLALAGWNSAAEAQEWHPAKPIKFIVTYAPGGSADVVARLLQGPMSEALGVPVIVENRAGAGGNLGSTAIARAEPDGYTIGMGASSTQGVNVALFGDKLPYRVPQDFTMISQIARFPHVIIVHPGVPAKNFTEFLAWVRANPGQAYGTGGVGTVAHLLGTLINQRFKVDLQHAPYKSGGPAIADLLAGHIKIVIDNITTAAAATQGGRARAIVVTTDARSSRLPDVPSFTEEGYRDMVPPGWQGLFGPAGMPRPVVNRLRDALVSALANPVVHQRLVEAGNEPVGSTPDEFAALVDAELPRWAELVKAAGLKND